jgi:hypothetical protein
MSPIFIQNGKILISGDKLRGCCCGGRWRISAVKINAFGCDEEEKGESIDFNGGAGTTKNWAEGIIGGGLNGEIEICSAGVSQPTYVGDIIGPITIDGIEYYELKDVPRIVDVLGWINEFKDGVNQEYPNPCDNDTFLLLDFIPICFPANKTVVDGDIVKSYRRIFPQSELEINENPIYEFTSTVQGNEGSTGAEAVVPNGCEDRSDLKASITRQKKVQYTIQKNEDGTCCLTNPVPVLYPPLPGENENRAENIICTVSCCEGGETSENTPIKTFWEIHMKLQVLCSNETVWRDLTNPTELTAPTSESEPGTGDPGVGEEDDSSWKIAICRTCNRPCYIECTDENEPDETAIKANLDLPPFLDMDEASICPE